MQRAVISTIDGDERPGRKGRSDQSNVEAGAEHLVIAEVVSAADHRLMEVEGLQTGDGHDAEVLERNGVSQIGEKVLKFGRGW